MIPESQGHLSTAKPRKRAPADFFCPTFISSSKPLSGETALSFQEVWPEHRLHSNTEEADEPSTRISRSLAPVKPGLLFTAGSSELTVALAAPISLAWETNTRCKYSTLSWYRKEHKHCFP